MKINYGYVYIVQNKRLNNLTGENIFKVGFSINPVGRLHGLEADCRVVDDWVLLGAYGPVPNQYDREIHKALRASSLARAVIVDYRQRGGYWGVEWYVGEPEIARKIIHRMLENSTVAENKDWILENFW